MRKKHVFKLSLLAGALVVSQGVWALGLGKMTVQSYLGHPLRAEIELMGTKEEFADLKANIASPMIYQQKDLIYQAALSRTQIAVERREDGSAYLKISSPQSVAEPYLDLLIEVTWPTGHALREYTLLLDPPVSSTPEPIIPAQQATVAGRAEARAAEVAKAESAEERQKRLQAKPTATAAQKTAAGDNTYVVERGDTLTDIANSFKPQDVSLEQALVALYQTNPKAFQGKNMNRLRAGAILEIPDDHAFADVSQNEARKTVRVQVSEWRNYRAALVAGAPSAGERAGTQTDVGTITPRVTEGGVAMPPGDRVVVSQGAGTGGGESATQMTENMVAMQKALDEERDRVKALEKTVNDLKGMLDIKNQQLAELQGQAKDVIAAGQQAGEGVETPPTDATEQPPVDTMEQPSAAGTETAPLATTEPTETVQPEAEPAKAEPAPPPPPPKAEPRKRTPRATPPPTAEPGLMEKVMGFARDSWFFLVAIVVVLAAIIGYFIYRRRQSEYETIDSMFGATTTADSASTLTSSGSTFSATSSAAVPPAAGMPSPAAASSTAGSNSILSEFSREGLGSIDTGEVDPLAEADVYLAYGRAQQAEEILRDALNRDGSQQDVLLKLLEVLADQKKNREFETEANKLYSLTNGQGEHWRHAAELGRRLMPDNPRFAPSAPDIHDFMGTTAAQTATQTATKTATKTAVSEPTEPLGFGAAASVDPRAFSPMESESVAEAIARAASEKMDQQTAPPADSQLSMPGQASEGFSFDFDTPQQQVQQHDDLGVDLDLEELSRFRNFGKAEEQVDLGGTTTPGTMTAPSTTTTAPSTTTQTPTTTRAPATVQPTSPPAFTQGQPSSHLHMGIDDTGLSLDESIIDDPSVIDDRSVPLDYEGQWQDVATKLDLARAYQATGDIEACRDILQEVLKEGDDQQKAEAHAILEKL